MAPKSHVGAHLEKCRSPLSGNCNRSGRVFVNLYGRAHTIKFQIYNSASLNHYSGYQFSLVSLQIGTLPGLTYSHSEIITPGPTLTQLSLFLNTSILHLKSTLNSYIFHVLRLNLIGCNCKLYLNLLECRNNSNVELIRTGIMYPSKDSQGRIQGDKVQTIRAPKQDGSPRKARLRARLILHFRSRLHNRKSAEWGALITHPSKNPPLTRAQD